jgi:Mg-chelatase subunit ChlD
MDQNSGDVPMQDETVTQIDTSSKPPKQQVEEEKKEPIKVDMKYFKVGAGYVNAQLSTEMTGAKFRSLTNSAVIDEAAERERRRIGRALIICLDRSGSMSGKPYEVLKEGSIMIAKSIFENKEYEHFLTIFYENAAEELVTSTFEEYERKMNATNAGGGTAFSSAFDCIERFVKRTPALRDISIIFFTDGQDGNAANSLQRMDNLN